MPLADIPFKPGFFSDDTDRDVGKQLYWKNGDKVRFVNGLPQKLGGWVKDNSSTMTGIARDAVDWVTLRYEKFIAIGTTKKLYIWQSGTFYDITPIRASGTYANNPFATTNLSVVVTVTHTAHGATDGSYVTIGGATAVGGITPSGEYAVTYVDADHYTITHSAAATSTTTGGGAAVTYAYQINIGGSVTTAGLGYGAGKYNTSTWNTARASSSIITHTRVWGLDTWGEDLIACPLDGSIYVWDSSVGTGTRAALVSGAPTSNKWAMVSAQERHLVAFGAGGDPLLVEWCSKEDYTDWSATLTNTAGDYRLDYGSEIYSAFKVRDEHVIFTNAACYAMTFAGPPDVFDFKLLGSNGRVLGPNAVAQFAGKLYWLGSDNFYVYDGVISQLPCPVREHVFNDISATQTFAVAAACVNAYGEIWWLYPSLSASENDRYVVYNVADGTWVFGTLSRTALIGDSDIFNLSYGFDSSGYMYWHETGTDDNTSAMDAYIESGDVELPEVSTRPDTWAGNQLLHISKIVPDFKRLTGSVAITLTGKKYPQATETQVAGPLTITPTTKFINPRVRARQVSFKIESSAVGDDWRMGKIRYDAIPHGRR